MLGRSRTWFAFLRVHGSDRRYNSRSKLNTKTYLESLEGRQMMAGDSGDGSLGNVTNIAPELFDRHLVTSFVSGTGSDQNAGIPVTFLLDGASDTDGPGPIGVAIQSVNNSAGELQFTTDNGSSWTAIVGVGSDSALTLAPTARIRLNAAPGSFGSVENILTFAAWDQAAGSSGSISTLQSLQNAHAISATTDQLDVVPPSTAASVPYVQSLSTAPLMGPTPPAGFGNQQVPPIFNGTLGNFDGNTAGLSIEYDFNGDRIPDGTLPANHIQRPGSFRLDLSNIFFPIGTTNVGARVVRVNSVTMERSESDWTFTQYTRSPELNPESPSIQQPQADESLWAFVPNIDPDVPIPLQAEELTFAGEYSVLVNPAGFNRDSYSPERRFRPHEGATPFSLTDPNGASWTLNFGGHAYTIFDYWSWSVQIVTQGDAWSYLEFYSYTYTATANWTDTEGTSFVHTLSGNYSYQFGGIGNDTIHDSHYTLVEERHDHADLNWSFSGTFSNSYGSGSSSRSGDDHGDQNYLLTVNGQKWLNSGVEHKHEVENWKLDGYTEKLRGATQDQPTQYGTETVGTEDDDRRWWWYNSKITRDDIGGQKSHDDKFRYDVHEDELLPVTIHSISTVSELWGGSAFLKSVDKTDKVDTRIITDFYIEGTNKVEADGKRTIGTDYNLLWTRTDKINQVASLEDHVTDQSVVGALLISNASAGTIADTTSTLVRSAIAIRDISPTKNRFKVDFETDLTGYTTWSSWTINDLNGTDATAPGIATHVKILANSNQLGTVNFGANVSGTTLRTGDTTTTSATSSTSHDSGGSTFSNTVVDMDAVGDSQTPNSKEHVDSKSNTIEVSNALWTTHSWTQGSLPVGGNWSYDEGMNYQVDGFEDTKYDRSGNGNSTVTTSPALGVTETTVQIGSEGSTGKSNYIGSANGSWSRVSGVITAHDFSTYTLTSNDHSTTDSKTKFTRVDKRSSGTVTNSSAEAKFSSIIDSKGEDKSTKIYDEISGFTTRTATADTKLEGTTQTFSLNDSDSTVEEILPDLYSTTTTLTHGKRDGVIAWLDKTKLNSKFDSTIGSEDNQLRTYTESGNYLLDGWTDAKNDTTDKTDKGLTRVASSKTTSSYDGKGTSTGAEDESLYSKTGVQTIHSARSNYAIQDIGKNNSHSETTSTIDGTKDLTGGYDYATRGLNTKEIHSSAKYLEDRLGAFVTNSIEKADQSSIGEFVQFTSFAHFDNDEQGKLESDSKFDSIVTAINRLDAKYRSTDKTVSKLTEKYKGQYESAALDESYVFADGKTDSYSRATQWSVGKTDETSDVETTGSSKDARGTTGGYNMNAKDDAPQLFLGKVIIKSNDSHRVLSGKGESKTSEREIHYTDVFGNTLNLNESFETNDAKADITLDKSKSTVTTDERTYGGYESTSTQESSTIDRDATSSSNFHFDRHDLTINGLHSAEELSTDQESGFFTDDNKTTRDQSKYYAYLANDYLSTRESSGTQTQTHKGSGIYSKGSRDEFKLFADATTTTFSSSQNSETGIFDEDTEGDITGSTTEQSIEKVTNPDYEEGKSDPDTKQVYQYKDYADYKSYNLDQVHNAVYTTNDFQEKQTDRKNRFSSTSHADYTEDGDRTTFVSHDTSSKLDDYAYKDKSFVRNNKGESHTWSDQAGTRHKYDAYDETDSTLNGRHSHSETHSKETGTIHKQHADSSSEGKWKETREKGVKISGDFKNTQESNGGGDYLDQTDSESIDSTSTLYRLDSSKVDGDERWSKDSKATETKEYEGDEVDRTQDADGATIAYYLDYDWTTTVTSHLNGTTKVASEVETSFNRFASGETRTRDKDVRKETDANEFQLQTKIGTSTTTRWISTDGQADGIPTTTVVNDLDQWTTTWSSKTSTDAITQSKGDNSTTTDSYRNESIVSLWNDNTFADQATKTKVIGAATLTTQGHDYHQTNGKTSTTREYDWHEVSINGGAANSGGSNSLFLGPTSGQSSYGKSGFEETRVNGSGDGSWDQASIKTAERKVPASPDSVSILTSDVISDNGKSHFSLDTHHLQNISATGVESHSGSGTMTSKYDGTKLDIQSRSNSTTTYRFGDFGGNLGTWTEKVEFVQTRGRGDTNLYGADIELTISFDSKNGNSISTPITDTSYDTTGPVALESTVTTTSRLEVGQGHGVTSKKVETKSSSSSRTKGDTTNNGTRTVTDNLTNTKFSGVVLDTDQRWSSQSGSTIDKYHQDHSTTVTDKLTRKDQYSDSTWDWTNDWFNWGWTDGSYTATHRERTEWHDKGEGSSFYSDGTYDDCYGYFGTSNGDYNTWQSYNELIDDRTRSESRQDGSPIYDITLTTVFGHTTGEAWFGFDKGTTAGSSSSGNSSNPGGNSGYGGDGSLGGDTGSGDDGYAGYGGSWDSSSINTYNTLVGFQIKAHAIKDLRLSSDDGGGYGSGGGFSSGFGGGSGGLPGPGDDPIFGWNYSDGSIKLLDFSGKYNKWENYQSSESWNNTGIYEGYRETPSGWHGFQNIDAEVGTYTFLTESGQVLYEGWGYSMFQSWEPNFSLPIYRNPQYILQVDLPQFEPRLDAVNWDSLSKDLARSAKDINDYLQSVDQALLDEIYLFWNDFGGNWEYYEFLVQEEIDTYKSAFYGAVDGFLDTMNPFDYFLSVPDIGPIKGHEMAYTVGYGGGVLAGVGVQIGIGILSGGATAPACAGSIAKIGLYAAKLYTVIDTIGAIGAGISIANKTYSKWGELSGWERAGNIAMAGLNFAAGIGHLGGAVMKKLNGPIDLGHGGCFVAGTKVSVSALPILHRIQKPMYLSVGISVGFGDAEFGEFLGADTSDCLVPIEDVPLGARVGTKNPVSSVFNDEAAPRLESDFRCLRADVLRDNGSLVEIELLRPSEWIEEQGFAPGDEIRIDLAEMDVQGWATIRSIEPCPSLARGDGNLVTGRFITHNAANLIEATFDDGTIVKGTSTHPVWSLNRLDWVPLGELAIGEHVDSLHGPVKLVDKLRSSNPEIVYNIEVDCEHVYRVGESGILVHNSCLGDMGEAGAKGWLKRHGYTEIRSIQNRSGHGIDIVARHRDGTLTFFEVKSSSSGKMPKLSEAQSHSHDFIKSRLKSAGNAGSWWKKTPDPVRNDAIKLLAEVNRGKFRTYVIEISHATDPSQLTGFRIIPWPKDPK